MGNRELIRQAELELARREFFFYCHLMSPDFYESDRSYLLELCQDMQEFVESEDDVLIINLPPRHGNQGRPQCSSSGCLEETLQRK